MEKIKIINNENVEISRDNYDHYNPEDLKFKASPGINEELVREISKDKNEPEWMLQKRLTGLRVFLEKPLPTWGPDLSKLNLNEIIYYMKPNAKKNSKNWEEVPEEIRKTYEKLGIPQAEVNSLGGVGAQYESEIVYHNLKKDLEDKGVVFLDMDQAVKEYPELVKKYFMTTCVPINLHKFSALHAAVWSGGTFIYVPKNLKVDIPLQAYFRMNAKKGGQFEHTLIIVDEGAQVHYIEGCFSKGNKIITEDDYKNIENIKIGDFVLTSEGEYKKVNEISVMPYSGEIYEIKVYGDSTQTIIATAEHPFLYVDRKSRNNRNKIFNPIWNIPKFFRKGDYLAVPINKIIKHEKYREFEVDYKKNKEKIKVPMSQDLFRLIGYYLAEGSTIGEHYLCFDFNIKEREYIEDVKNILKTIFNVKPYEQPHKINNGVSVRVNSTKLARLFKMFGDRNYNKKIPKWAMFENIENQAELIKGWFRGDGNYYNKNYKSGLKEIFRINSTSQKLIMQGRDILLRLGIFAFINKRDRIKENRRVMYTLGISGEQMIKFSDIVDIKIKAKINDKNRASMFGINKNFAFIPIKEISSKSVEDIPVYNLSIQDHETYTVGGVAVHNCSAPIYSENSLHAGCVEIHVFKGARARYSSIENWSKNTYNLNTKRAIVHKDAIMEWVNGNLGCLTEGSKIFTLNKGPININKIEKGEEIYVWDEKTNMINISKVKEKIYSGDKKVYKLEAGGREIEASGNHPFITLGRKKHKEVHKKGFFFHEWKQLDELKKGDIIGISKKLPLSGKAFMLPKVNIQSFVESKNQYSKFKMNISHLYNQNIYIPKKTNEDFMWLMGIILGDGHIDIKNNKINIATHIKEDFRDKLVNILKDLFGYEVTEKKERYIIINSKVLCELFDKIGFSGTAGSKIIPNWVNTLPENQILSFIAGYLDSDGHISSNAVYFTSINKNLLEELKILGIQTGFGVSKIYSHGKAKKTQILGKYTDAKDSWRILFDGIKVKELPSKCLKKKGKIMLIKSRRKDSTSKGLNFQSKVNEEVGFVRIKNIEEVGIKPTYDIEVEDYQNFIANGIIVHNSKITMLYPCSVLIGEGAKSDYIGIQFANKGQYQDTGCKVYHYAPNTSSSVLSKGISKNGGVASYRGLIHVKKGCKNSNSIVRCDGLMLDNISKAITFPSMEVEENDVKVAHEASVGKVGEDQLFYLMSRGLSEEEATNMIVSGYIEPVIKELPLEYAVELNRLIELEIENSVC